MKLFYSFGKLQNHLPPTKDFFCTQALIYKTPDKRSEILSFLKASFFSTRLRTKEKNYIHPITNNSLDNRYSDSTLTDWSISAITRIWYHWNIIKVQWITFSTTVNTLKSFFSINYHQNIEIYRLQIIEFDYHCQTFSNISLRNTSILFNTAISK